MLKIGTPGNLVEIREKVYAGERLSFEDGLKLFESNNLTEIGRLANMVRERLHGDKAYFSHKYRLYPTNICMYRCRFCAFRVSKGDERGYEWPAEKTLHELSKVDLSGVSEFHIVGGVHPDWGFDVYLDIIRELHRAYPEIHLKAWTAVEIDAFTHLTGKSIRWVLEEMREAGLGSLPGGGAEIFDWEVRRTICRTKCTGERWLEVHETAHEMGMKTNSTMLY
ncbi:MAG: radical SAM protein, partial [Actinomycetota bacterium]|nr:radical SAM protein [Actinomycetota bacterium]